MQIKQLGRTGIMMSNYCLGTMTFGTQTDQNDAFRQMDMALDAGINIFDTAEMYPVNPVSAATQGASEEIIGRWLAQSGRRSEVLIATKQAGNGLKHIRDGAPICAKTIPQAIENSLKRLQTDVIDLYQFHWPNRGSYMFRQNWKYDPSAQNKTETIDNMHECLNALQAQVDRGTIRSIGLSNETAWGTTQWLRASEEGAGPRVAALQNEYSLLCRMYDTDLAEMGINEDVGLLAYSPLAAGILTGKYSNGAVPKGSRMDANPDLSGRYNERSQRAAAAYVDLAGEYGLDPIHMALAWGAARPFMGSVIVGATNAAQLEHIIAGKDVTVPPDLAQKINTVHRKIPMPY